LQARLRPADATANTSFGGAVALSADGNTALIGDVGLHTVHGCCALPAAVWVFVRSGRVWKQQWPALMPGGSEDASAFGQAVALSADGNTALVGARNRDSAWVFVRTGSKWAQQGPVLTSDEPGVSTWFGQSVALSWDGNTALVGGPRHGSLGEIGGNEASAGAVWVFTRSGSTWTQQGPRLTARDGAAPSFGITVALSGDGNVALVGGSRDNHLRGAAWVFTRTGAAWKQQGPKLSPDDPTLNSFGEELTLSANGKVALVGAWIDGNFDVWAYARTASGWVQQGAALDRRGELQFGWSFALTPDGTTALIGGSDRMGAGTAWLIGSPATAFSAASRPAITAMAPAKARVGAGVTISGTNLAGAALVRFAGIAARFRVLSATSVEAIVPRGLKAGKVRVTTPNGTATSATALAVMTG
jgi:hypothetical protein